MKTLIFPSTLVLFFLSACTVINSTPVPQKAEATPDGLTYFMPRRDFIVSIEMGKPDGKTGVEVTNVTFSRTAAFADRSQVYILNIGKNLLADTKLTISVGENGLLKKSTAASTSQVEETFIELAKAAAQFELGAEPAEGEPPLPDVCSNPGTYTFVYEPTTRFDTKCGVEISITPAPEAEHDALQPSSRVENIAYSGVFYRQEKAYLLKAEARNPTGRIFSKSEILMSPSESKTQFLPISRSFFADSTGDITFVDGVPTDYDQDNKSEAVGLLTIPAKVVGAYFAAVGEIFSAFGTTKTNEAALLGQEKDLQLAKYNSERDLELEKAKADYKYKLLEGKVNLCAEAVKQKNSALVDELKCAEL